MNIVYSIVNVAVIYARGFCFFFFKQKTAYEMRISDWSSDVCSSDLMTEPAVASSDATNIQTRIERDGDHYVINGRKWWSSGVGDPRCKVAIVMGKTDRKSTRLNSSH